MPQIAANGITLEYDVHGPESGEPLLLIMGLGAQMTHWPQAFIDDLAARGYRVIRHDNRDVGLSEKLDAAGAPDPARRAAVLDAVKGRLDGRGWAAFHAGDLPDHPGSVLDPARASDAAWLDAGYAQIRVLPPPGLVRPGHGLPNIRLDRAIDFLIGDRL